MADQLLTYIILPPGQAGLQDDPGGGVQGAGPPFSPEADWALLSGMLSRELPREAALTLAEPRAGPGGTLGWHTPLEGIPRELSALKGREREEAERALGERASQFAALGARLASAPSPESKAAARLLSRLSAALAAAAAGLPGREIVYVVGKSPVVACWARPPEPEPQAAPPPPPPVPEPEPYPGPYEEAPAAPPLAYAAPPAAAAPEAAAGPGLLRMAGAALLAFLFLVFLFFLLAPGFRRAASAISGEDPAAGLDPGLEDGLRRELASLRERYEETLTACRPEETGPLIEDDPPELPEPDAQILMPPSSGDAEGGVEAAQPPPPPPPPPEEKPKEDPKAKPKEKPKEKPKGGQQRGGQLRIPDNPSDLSFLQGCWKSDAGIVDRINRMPLMYYYCFNGSTGAASVRVEEQDNRGRVRNVCTTTGKARLSGKGVTIRDNGAKCPGSVPNYVPGTVNCAPSSGGSARCTVQSDGGPRIQTRFTYQG